MCFRHQVPNQRKRCEVLGEDISQTSYFFSWRSRLSRVVKLYRDRVRHRDFNAEHTQYQFYELLRIAVPSYNTFSYIMCLLLLSKLITQGQAGFVLSLVFGLSTIFEFILQIHFFFEPVSYQVNYYYFNFWLLSQIQLITKIIICFNLY